ncbi:MAG: glycoside hydrolase [Planctomycetaceae bacterium]|nr:glycoside hydrolase [Planctomycetaceae bacterium]
MKTLTIFLSFIIGLVMTISVFAEDILQRITIPEFDLSQKTDWQFLVDKEQGQYLGHVTTCLLDDGKTILCVYPKGHGRGAIVYKRSMDGGKTWSDRLPTPKSWETSLEVPTLHRTVDADGKKRIIMFSGLYPARMAVSENEGETWSELQKVGDWGGIVVMGEVIALNTGKGHYMAMFHDDGKFFTSTSKKGIGFTLYKTLSTDGGLTWSYPESILNSKEIYPCEPGIVRSPDGKRIAVLLRENSRKQNSQIIFSDDEGKTWTKMRPMPAALNGDRHTIRYTKDGRLFIAFREMSLPQNRTSSFGDWVSWIGTFEDLENGTEGQYRLRIMDNKSGADSTYPGVVVLPDGMIVTTTYGHWTKDEKPYIMTVRIDMNETDQMYKNRNK